METGEHLAAPKLTFSEIKSEETFWYISWKAVSFGKINRERPANDSLVAVSLTGHDRCTTLSTSALCSVLIAKSLKAVPDASGTAGKERRRITFIITEQKQQKKTGKCDNTFHNAQNKNITVEGVSRAETPGSVMILTSFSV